MAGIALSSWPAARFSSALLRISATGGTSGSASRGPTMLLEASIPHHGLNRHPVSRHPGCSAIGIRRDEGWRMFSWLLLLVRPARISVSGHPYPDRIACTAADARPGLHRGIPA
ncbi:hypothetical protein C4552_03870 [Candidatus Parcubacteria bacterium]|nr:MAG: hypothetical protein C4552_03870 [Candidatus Parcubacteria bacterium]